MANPDDSVDDDEVDDHDDRPTPIHPLAAKRQWPLGVSGLAGIPPIISEPDRSTPLDSDHEVSDIPVAPLWAMKYLRHSRLEPPMSDDDDRIRWATPGDDPRTTAYVIDDGDRHCMLARTVGSGFDRATYHLVARVDRLDFEDVRSGWTEAVDLWAKAKEFTLCAVAEGAISNVVSVKAFRRLDDVPGEYLPPSDLLSFDEPL